jgi:C4-dicarboxylate-specific signal transduction histidine kinase
MDLLGYVKEDFLGKTVEELIMEKGSAFLFSNAIDHGLNNYETIFVSKYGRKIPVLLSCSAIKEKKGGIMYIVCTAKDISERKQSEEELKKAYASLKDLQSQLVQSEKMGAIGQLAGGVAHEINNPLTGVLNNAQLIKMMAGAGKELKFDEIKDLLDAIEESALRCKKITESLLDFSHTSMGGFKPISLNAVIDKVVGLIGTEMKLQNIELKVELQPDLPQVLGDSQLLQQILVNLISNAKWAAAKKFDKGGGLISVKTETESGKGFINLYVADNGIGIDGDKIAKIFNPFFTTKQVGEGTGLGLSVAYNIIKKHRGKIEVSSKKNEGSTFKIVLPAVS